MEVGERRQKGGARKTGRQVVAEDTHTVGLCEDDTLGKGCVKCEDDYQRFSLNAATGQLFV